MPTYEKLIPIVARVSRPSPITKLHRAYPAHSDKYNDVVGVVVRGERESVDIICVYADGGNGHVVNRKEIVNYIYLLRAVHRVYGKLR